MPKVKISEYSATANSNTDVASINIDEGCAPSGINNAIRAVMGHLKDFQQGTYGDAFNGPVNGTLGATTASTANVTTLTTSSTVTHNGGTANGVAYLDGSKVLTTGSALAFNGSKLGIGVTSFDVPLQVQAITGGLAMRFNGRASPADSYSDIGFYNSANTTQVAGIGAANSGLFFATSLATPITFTTNNAEVGRFDASSNFLVGTTTASGKVSIVYDGSSVVGENIADAVNTTNSTFMQFTIQGTQVGTIKRVGATSAVIYNTSSDYRLKTVVGAVTGQGERIDALKPIDYQWKEGNTPARGFLAHDFKAIYPNSVSGDKDDVDADGKPVYQAMQAGSSEVIADLVAEIQSLRKRLAALESA